MISATLSFSLWSGQVCAGRGHTYFCTVWLEVGAMEDTLTITGLLLGSSGLECFFVDSTSWGMFLVKLG